MDDLIMTVVGARPQFIKAKPVGDALQRRGATEILVHTGQHYDDAMSAAIFRDLGLRQADVNLGVGSGSHAEQTAAMLTGLEALMQEHAPAMVLVYGDTNSTLAGALAAAKIHIPVAHVEAGLRSHNRLMPEELNRIATDHLADLLLAPTELAVQNLTEEGLAARTVRTGDVMFDMLRMADLSRVVRPEWARGDYVVATIHRAENTDDPERLGTVMGALAAIRMPVHLLAHPRLVAAAERSGIALDQGSLHHHGPLPYSQLLSAANGAAAVITDSGGLQKEAYLLGTSCTTIRRETEWPETLAGSMNRLAGDKTALAMLDEIVFRPVSPPDAAPYGDGRAAEIAVDAIDRFVSH